MVLRSDVAGVGSPVIALSNPGFPPEAHQGNNDSFIRLGTHEGHIYHRCGCDHARLADSVFNWESPRALTVDESHFSAGRRSTRILSAGLTESYASMRPIKHAYSGVRFSAPISLFDGRSVSPGTTLFLEQHLHTRVVVIEAASGSLNEYLAGVGHQ